MIPVLMIALEFPPVQTAGAFRAAAFARHLSPFGYMPVVVSIDPAQGSAIFNAPIDDALLATLPADLAITRLRSAREHRSESRLKAFIRIATHLDDGFFQHFRASLAEHLAALKREHAPRLVYVSAPPFGAAQLGAMAAETLRVPLVLDMRDAWAEWDLGPLPTILHHRARRRDERRAFARATAVIAVTERLRDLFRGSHPSLPPERFHVVPNGFDGLMPQNGAWHVASDRDTFNMAYVGSFYYTPPKPRSLRRPHALLHYRAGREDWSYRSPLFFFRAWQALAAKDGAAAARLRFHHFGKTPEWLPAMAAAHGVADRCIFHGSVHKTALPQALAGTDAFLATSMKRADGGDYCLASKTFDYLGAGKPILAVVTAGTQRDFFRRSGGALICDPDDLRACTAALAALLDGAAVPPLDYAYLQRFTRHEGARRLAAVFDTCVLGAPHLADDPVA